VQDVGKPLDIIQGTIALGDPGDPRNGLFLVTVPDAASRHDVEALVEHLQLLNIQALVVMESAIKEVRQLDKSDLENLKATVDEALGLMYAAEEFDSPNDMTATRVVSALRKKPRLLRDVYDRLQAELEVL
jgi:hypothetical protein